MKGEWNSPGILYTCQYCGVSLIGDGFWTPCQSDETEYQIKIHISPLSNIQILVVSKALAIPVLQLKELSMNKMINKKFRLPEVSDFMSLLKKNEIAYEIIPEFMYPDYWSCKRHASSKCRNIDTVGMKE